MKKRLFAFLLVGTLLFSCLPYAAVAAEAYQDLILESLYFTDVDGMVKLSPIGRDNMVPRIALSKAEGNTDFSGTVTIEAYGESGEVLATSSFELSADTVVFEETFSRVTRGVYAGSPMNIPAGAVGVRALYSGLTAEWNPAPAGSSYIGELIFPEPFDELMKNFTVSKEEGVRQYSTTMSPDSLWDWSDATEIFLSSQVDYAATDVKNRTGLEKSAPITGRNFADNYKNGLYGNQDTFIFTIVDDFYGGTPDATGNNVHTIPLNDFSYNNKLGSGEKIHALIRSGSPSGETWMGSLHTQDSSYIAERWTAVSGHTGALKTTLKSHPNSYATTALTLYNFAARDEYGIPKPYILVDSVDEVAATPGTFYQDGLAIYCHPRAGEDPADIDIQWRDGFLSGIRHTGAASTQTIIFENISFMARPTDHVNNQFAGGDYDKAIYGFFSCRFAGSAQNALGMAGKYTVYLNNCVAAYGYRDNYNYHAQKDGGFSRAIEINCISYGNGSYNRIFDSYVNDNPQNASEDPTNSNNASTAHDQMYMLRIGGRYFNSQGHHVGDTDTKMTMNIGIEIYDMMHSPNHGHAFGIASAPGWVIDCYATGTRFRHNVSANTSTCYVTDLCGLQKTGSGSQFYSMQLLSWKKMAAGEWYAGTYLPKDPEIGYQAALDFSMQQGLRSWVYGYFPIGKYETDNFKAYTYNNDDDAYNNGNSTRGQISCDGKTVVLEAGAQGDAALVFSVPQDGTVTVSVSGGEVSLSRNSKDGGWFGIFKNGERIVPADTWLEIAPGDAVTVETVTLTVEEGDMLVFRANKGIEATSNSEKNNKGDAFTVVPIVKYVSYGLPAEPENPENPDTPENPDNPENPGEPSTPENPGEPSDPNEPAAPPAEEPSGGCSGQLKAGTAALACLTLFSAACLFRRKKREE